MNLLLDTCALVWLLADPTQLSPVVSSLIDSPDTKLWASDGTVWEICLKWQSGKLKLPKPPRLWLDEQQKIWNFTWLAIDRLHLFRVSELPPIHRDPFDRLLIAQAIEGGLTIATPDQEICKYPVATIW